MEKNLAKSYAALREFVNDNEEALTAAGLYDTLALIEEDISYALVFVFNNIGTEAQAYY